MIELNEVSYRYPKGSFAINGLCLSVKAGECTALCGVNGSGKTTIAKLMAGLIRPDSGSILMDKEDTKDMSLGRIGTKVGFLFQEPSRQLFAVTVMEELTFAETIKGKEEKQAVERAKRVLERFDMGNMGEQNVLNLSRGEKQRLAICALLLCEPKILILDEPTSGLDEEAAEKLSLTIEKLVASGTGVVLISHDERFVARHANRVLKVSEGSVYEQ